MLLQPLFSFLLTRKVVSIQECILATTTPITKWSQNVVNLSMLGEALLYVYGDNHTAIMPQKTHRATIRAIGTNNLYVHLQFCEQRFSFFHWPQCHFFFSIFYFQRSNHYLLVGQSEPSTVNILMGKE